MAVKVDVTGQRFGRLVVLHEDGNRGGYVAWACRCDCGEKVTVTGKGLRKGTTQSCGCFKNDLLKARRTTHGHRRGFSTTPEYRTWMAMIQRCTYPNSVKYPRYGGRGITVCDRWRTFENFLSDMGSRPLSKTLDRIDNDGNYEPGNCRWATAKEQIANRPKSPFMRRNHQHQLTHQEHVV